MNKAASASCAPASSAWEGKSLSLGLGGRLFPPCRPTHAEQDSRDQETCKGCPFEAKRILANVGGLAIVAEIVSTFNISRRHQGYLNDLEKHGNHGQKTTQIAANSSAQCQKPSEERAYSKEERNEHECKHEPSHVEIVAMVIDKVARDVYCCVEGAMRGWVKRICRMNIRIVLITTDGAAILYTADIPV